MMRPVDPLLDTVKKYWDYDSLRPLQREAMTAAVEGRDSLVVLPTGGGKSLCYQAPALLSDRLTVVVSPLISLMKDQVDRLLSRGVSAAFINSSLESSDKSRVQAGIARGEYKLIFVAPERFGAGSFEQVLRRGRVGAFAIDEAHCISHWGHDFRVDYREMGRLKKEFPDASVHAFTATAAWSSTSGSAGNARSARPATSARAGSGPCPTPPSWRRRSSPASCGPTSATAPRTWRKSWRATGRSGSSTAATTCWTSSASCPASPRTC